MHPNDVLGFAESCKGTRSGNIRDPVTGKMKSEAKKLGGNLPMNHRACFDVSDGRTTVHWYQE
jgi:hypothetical protein